jgi:hypothetical protein
MEPQISALKEGFYAVVPPLVLPLLTWRELERKVRACPRRAQRRAGRAAARRAAPRRAPTAPRRAQVCGTPTVDLAQLRRITVHNLPGGERCASAPPRARERGAGFVRSKTGRPVAASLGLASAGATDPSRVARHSTYESLCFWK